MVNLPAGAWMERGEREGSATDGVGGSFLGARHALKRTPPLTRSKKGNGRVFSSHLALLGLPLSMGLGLVPAARLAGKMEQGRRKRKSSEGEYSEASVSRHGIQLSPSEETRSELRRIPSSLSLIDNDSCVTKLMLAQGLPLTHGCGEPLSTQSVIFDVYCWWHGRGVLRA